MTTKKRILLGSPIRQKPAILHEFLESLKRLEKSSYDLDYFFVDDNDDPASSELLKKFYTHFEGHVLISPANRQHARSFLCTEITHFWDYELIRRVASFKDSMIERTLKEKYDYLFLIDSDLLLHPKTIERLLETKKEIVATIFWTQWNELLSARPQVRLLGQYAQHELEQYRQYEHELHEDLSKEELKKRRDQVCFDILKKPGTYEVGFLGACTLISNQALQKGLSFKLVKNLELWGEDNHFCVRATILGCSLFVDTHYPAYHIYRDSNLAAASEFIEKTRN